MYCICARRLIFLLASIELDMVLNELSPLTTTRTQPNCHLIPNSSQSTLKPNRTEPSALNLLPASGSGGGGVLLKDGTDSASVSGVALVGAEPATADTLDALPTRTPPARPIRHSRYVQLLYFYPIFTFMFSTFKFIKYTSMYMNVKFSQ